MKLTKYIAALLRDVADKLDAGTSTLTEQEALDVIDLLAHREMSKDQACRYLNMSRATFDAKVQAGILPKGRKRIGFKELAWYRDELDRIIFKV